MTIWVMSMSTCSTGKTPHMIHTHTLTHTQSTHTNAHRDSCGICNGDGATCSTMATAFVGILTAMLLGSFVIWFRLWLVQVLRVSRVCVRERTHERERQRAKNSGIHLLLKFVCVIRYRYVGFKMSEHENTQIAYDTRVCQEMGFRERGIARA